MLRALAVVAYIALTLIAMFVANDLLYYISPVFAWLHPIARRLTGFVACLSLPAIAYQLAIKELDETPRVAIWSSGAWVLLTLTSPSGERQEQWTVQGLVGDRFSENVITTKIKCHCYEDAVAAARLMYKSHKDWPQAYSELVHDGDPSEFSEADVKIEYFSTTPSLDWINSLFDTSYGTKTYITTLRYIDHHEDPFQLAEDLYRAELGYDYRD